MLPAPIRTRPRRPIMKAIKNPCCGSCAATARNPVRPGPGVTQTQPGYQTAAAQTQQYSAIRDNALFGNLGDAWLPASTGPQPQGASIWVVWNGGTSGTRRYSGSTMSQPVQVLQHMQGGPTGVMVLVRPSLAAAGPVANPAPTCDPATCKWVCLPMPSPSDPHDQHCVAVPKNVRIPGAYFTSVPPTRSACPESAPYVCTGFPGQCSAYPSDHPLHGIDCKSYTTQPQQGPRRGFFQRMMGR